MIVQTPLMTAEELEQLPHAGRGYELVKGVLHKMPPAGEEHGGFAGVFHTRLHIYVLDHQLGRVYSAETGFVLARNPDTVRGPDVAFVSRERLERLPMSSGYRQEAPDLVAEVISPNDTYSEVAEKVSDWLTAGVRMVVVIDPRKRSVTVYRPATGVLFLTEANTLDGGDVVPGWQLAVREIFA